MSGILPAWRYKKRLVESLSKIRVRTQVANEYGNLLFVGRHDELRRIPPLAVFEPKRTEAEFKASKVKMPTVLKRNTSFLCAGLVSVRSTKKEIGTHLECLSLFW